MITSKIPDTKNNQELYSPQLPPLELPDSLLAVDGHRKSIIGDAKDSALDEALEAHKFAAEGWAKFNQFRAAKNPSDTVSKHFEKLKDGSEKLVNSITVKNNQARQRLQRRKAEIEEQIKLRLIEHSPDAQEIRNAIRTMPPQQRTELIESAIHEGDRVLMGALFGTSSSVTLGLKQSELEAYRQMAERKHAADLNQLKERLNRAEKLLTDVSFASVDLKDRAIGNPALQERFAAQAVAADKAAIEFSRYT